MKYILNIIFLFLSSPCFSQVLSNTGAVANIAYGTVISVGSLENNTGTLTNGGAIHLTSSYANPAIVNGSGNYTIAGNWFNNGTFTSGAGTVTFNGTGQQTFTGVGSFSNLALNNSSGLSLNNNLTVTGALTLTSGALSIASNTLTLNGAVTGSGTIKGSSTSNITLGGTAGTLNFTSGFRTLKDLTLNMNATASLGTSLDIVGGAASGNVIVNSGATLTTAGNLILKSDANGTANIGNSAGFITGNVIVERYIPGRRRYRLITSSVTTSANASLIAGEEALSIWGNWQNQGNNVAGNTGTIITGGTSGDGFDQQTPNASLFTYDDVNRTYVRYNTANGKNTKYTPLKAGIAYYMFVYGDRLNTVSTANPNNTVIKATGTLLMGDQTYNTGSTLPLSNVTGRFTLLGNPFASPIDWTTLPKTNLANTYWGWDPSLSSTGGYITVSTTGTATLIAPFSGTVGLNQYIQPGQGFFVKTTAASPVLTIREQDKVSNFNSNAFRTNDNTSNDISLMAVNLLYNNGSIKVLADGALIAFDSSFSNQVGNEDGIKFIPGGEGIALENGSELLSIDARQMPQDNDTLFLNTARLTKPQYTLQIFTKKMSGSNLQPYLRDKFLNTVKLLSLIDTNNIVFSITSDNASFNKNRFQVFFKISGVLPVSFTSVKAIQKEENIQVEWNVATEIGIQKYEVQHADDGINFIKKGEVFTCGNNSNANYRWIDMHVVNKTNYYRIRSVQADGKYNLSKIVVVKMDKNNAGIKVFPNPVKNQQINLQGNDIEKGLYTFDLINTAGQKIMTSQFNHTGGTLNKVITPTQKLTPGFYYLKVTSQAESYHQILFIE